MLASQFYLFFVGVVFCLLVLCVFVCVFLCFLFFVLFCFMTNFNLEKKIVYHDRQRWKSIYIHICHVVNVFC